MTRYAKAQKGLRILEEIGRQCGNTADDIDILLDLIEKLTVLCPNEAPPAPFAALLKGLSADLRDGAKNAKGKA